MSNTHKKTMLWLAAAALMGGIAVQTVHAQEGVKIYGIFDGGLDISHTDGSTTGRVISGGAAGSRLGFIGSENLRNGWSANFRLENGFAGNTGMAGQGGRLFGREASVGISHEVFGALTLGRIPTPISLAQSKIDAFHWMGSGGLISLSRGAKYQVAPQVVSARVDNAINYVSPEWNGWRLTALASINDRVAALGDAYGVSLRYTNGPLDILAAYGRQQSGRGGTGHLEAWLVGGSYDFDNWRMYLGYTGEKNSCSNCLGSFARLPGSGTSNISLWNIGVRIPFGFLTAIAQITRVIDSSDYLSPAGNRNATWLAVGAEYRLSRRTLLYAALGTIDNQNGSGYTLGSGGVQMRSKPISAGDDRSTTVSLGIKHIF
ncbi:porin [Pusillimonas noertemannii]|uniref:Putative porin n=1 Tax=Pusillimonas noertemannii TaxID=305977 RepID=A0A2U1CJS0_9BURK|nr:porin [Pusillimonas noertemannii]NYT69825.1 porin [Pusillimonas noertemannii]PVY61251.1 putative porin [Pusillimonas noertemannii]TFL09126.1 porin [Pusillimonas noertemannii]